MTSPALILLHAPSVYDFRQETILRGPVSDLVPSSSIFEMYPIGFTTLSAYLEDRGYTVRIVNLAARMLADRAFDVEAFIASLPRPLAFGIDLHWLPHAHGALAIAEIVKRLHPDVPLMTGGFSSTYYHEELIRYPQVDLVMRGDSTEGPVAKLMDALNFGLPLEDVPNLTWKDKAGEAHVNPMREGPPDLGEIEIDYRRLMAAAARDRDLPSYLPFMGWLQYPIMPAVSCRGCIMNCAGCGGSAFAFRHMHGRRRPAFRPPDMMANDLRQMASVTNGPIFVLGDIRQAGQEYAERFLQAARGIDVPVIIELFWPAGREFLKAVSRSLPRFALEISLESHDEEVRRAFGKPYRNEAIEESMATALEFGAQRLDVFFMVGLTRQTYQSVLDTAPYTEYLLERFGTDGRLRPFVGPMAPFVDPGSLAFEQPEQHGYHIFYRTLEEHRRALAEPSWQFTLNYETQWMTRREIVQSTYEVGQLFNHLKVKYGLVDAGESARVEEALREGSRLAGEIEQLRAAGDQEGIRALGARIDSVNGTRVLEEKSELNLPVNQAPFKLLRLGGLLVWSWLRYRWLLLTRRPVRPQDANTLADTAGTFANSDQSI
ncbi:MAG: TIGR04190 family B12-binding domain/radical SAM domain protein [Anaerolineae bacterium]|nr:TIGR04190 family B12-binding domain/radical SAM domain protein [Anaerolineae bacterium]